MKSAIISKPRNKYYKILSQLTLFSIFDRLQLPHSYMEYMDILIKTSTK